MILQPRLTLDIAHRYVSVDSGGRKSSVDESGDSTVSLGMKAKAYASKRSNINARYIRPLRYFQHVSILVYFINLEFSYSMAAT